MKIKKTKKEKTSMKLRIALSMSTAMVMCMLVASCGDSKPSVVNNVTMGLNLSVIKTIGNNSYIPLNLAGNTYDKQDLILNVLKKFEDANPDLEVISYEFDKQQSSIDRYDRVFGIWVHHRLRK